MLSGQVIAYSFAILNTVGFLLLRPWYWGRWPNASDDVNTQAACVAIMAKRLLRHRRLRARR
ncbi:hypothetical protein LP420_27925 [Massilia sp. B-10]|nr:hypothetical protein LP420_27925 [Massilia sp. B-10]